MPQAHFARIREKCLHNELYRITFPHAHISKFLIDCWYISFPVPSSVKVSLHRCGLVSSSGFRGRVGVHGFTICFGLCGLLLNWGLGLWLAHDGFAESFYGVLAGIYLLRKNSQRGGLGQGCLLSHLVSQPLFGGFTLLYHLCSLLRINVLKLGITALCNENTADRLQYLRGISSRCCFSVSFHHWVAHCLQLLQLCCIHSLGLILPLIV
mmetsp:Transcript_23382/g.44597  ORF Transcript_23382/g.44597 Transcript_23382/m.44597 type:complete len:210 (-) Transcript_23382:1342-1971(-)